MEIKTYLNEQRLVIERALEHSMLTTEVEHGIFAHHIEAMRYSLFVGGKRVRPILCLAAGQAIGMRPAPDTVLLPIACALECIHTYSLIHDDLPAMDNDDLRRGKPTSHILYGEAGAILAGDGLLTWAFDLLSNSEQNTLLPEKRLKIINLIARAAGSLGMVGGQALDIAYENKEFPFETLRAIHRSKTGALITASILAGAIAAGADQKQQEALTRYGEQVGLAFQIVDDLLNVTATTEQLGKAAGSDANKGKATYPAFFGIETTSEKAENAVQEALNALVLFDEKAAPLRAIARYILTRSN
ncbi:MAG: polyprenyl synthetase family protein [Desulfocapsaceae bacterium]|jgi:geranylgeranyl diphosphate synthase type II|nr:polyprenyl synthetase family protein [Desulfocapsaceae bacterium]